MTRNEATPVSAKAPPTQNTDAMLTSHTSQPPSSGAISVMKPKPSAKRVQ